MRIKFEAGWGLGVFLALAASGFNHAWADNQFRVRLLSDPTTLDWNIAHTDAETAVMMNIMEGLVEFDSAMKPKPLLASSWTVSADGKTYVFRLRTDVKWSDGKPLSADDFVFSWQRLLQPSTAAPYAYLLFDIDGAADFNARKTTDFSKVGVKALDAHTLQVRLSHAVAYFPQLLSFWVTFPVRRDLVDRFGTNWARAGKMVVLGPFVPVSYQAQNEILLKRNELYHGKRPAADSVVMRIVNDDSTAMNLFRSGQLDYVRPINGLEISEARSSPAFHTAPYYRTCFIHINTAKYPFSLVKVRQAIAQAIDRSKLAQVAHRELLPASSLTPDAVFPEGKNSVLPFDPVAAKKTLQESGAQITAPVDLTTFASDENTLIAQYLQDQLSRNAGIQAQIQMPDFATYRTQLEIGSGALFFRCWAADYADPDTFFSMFLSTSGNNRTGFKNPRYDEIVRQAVQTTNGPARSKLYREALDLLLRKEAAVIPLYYDQLTYVLNPRIKNFVINPLNYVFFRDIVFTN